MKSFLNIVGLLCIVDHGDYIVKEAGSLLKKLDPVTYLGSIRQGLNLSGFNLRDDYRNAAGRLLSCHGV